MRRMQRRVPDSMSHLMPMSLHLDSQIAYAWYCVDTRPMKSSLHNDTDDPRSIAESILAAMDQPPVDWLDTHTLWGAPATDFTVTLLSLRAAMMGASTGRTLYHHELRHRLELPPEARPEVQVWDASGVFTPYWADGILQEPKYFSFFQDAPFAAFNPNHRIKWRAHEMLHGAVGWFWREDMTRFEFYLASRINELLPVVHWYGFDEAFRPRCSEHLDTVLAREFCASCEDAAKHYWIDPDPSRLDAATEHIRAGLEHLNDELDVIEAEIESLTAIASPRGHLDASSDSIGYVHGHWNRCTSWIFGAWIEGFNDTQDYFTSIEAMIGHTRNVGRELLGGDLVYDPETAGRLRDRRHAQDIAWRCLVKISTDESSRYEDGLDRHLHRLADLTVTLRSEQACLQEVLQPLKETLVELQDDTVIGRGFEPTQSRSIAQLSEGLSNALPQTTAAIDDLSAIAEAFASTPVEHGRLDRRFADWLRSIDDPAAPIAEFEAWIAQPPRQDDTLENFGHTPRKLEELREGRVRLNSTYREMKLDLAEAAMLFDLNEACQICAVFLRGEAGVVIVEDEHAQAIECVRSGDVEGLLKCDADVLEALLATGVIAWLPAVSKP